MSNLLEWKGFNPHQAASKEEALHLLEQFDYELILIDLMLPEENGFRVFEHIRKYFPLKSRHTILTTSADEKFLARLPQEGWCAVLLKPFAVTEFFRIAGICFEGGHENTRSLN